VSDSAPPKPSVASKWNARYSYARNAAPQPAQVLIDGAQFLPSSGAAIDIACGLGANALHLAKLGFDVHAWDISSKAIDSVNEQCEHTATEFSLNAQVRDVVESPPAKHSADVIVVSRFLDRQLCSALADALRANGVLFYQTFLTGLSNTDYLLTHNELPQLFESLEQCLYVETPVDDEGFSEARFVGRKPVI